MLRYRTIKVRLYPSVKQALLFDDTFGACRFVYNKVLESKIKNWIDCKHDKNLLKNAKTISETTLKKEHEFLKQVDSIALQQSLRDMQKAFENYFRKKKQGKLCLDPRKKEKLSRRIFKSNEQRFTAYNPGHPKFKSKKDIIQRYRTFNVNDIGLKTKDNKIRLPKVGWVKFRGKKDLTEIIRQVTIEKDNLNNYYASFLHIQEVDEKQFSTKMSDSEIFAGDMSHKEFIVSGEMKFENPKFYRKTQKQIQRKSRELARKKIGSQNRNKARLKLAKVHKNLVNRRSYWLYEQANRVARSFKAVVIENLSIKGIQSLSSGHAKTISGDFNWGFFTRILESKCRNNFIHFIKVDRFFPSSKTCSNCGLINDQLTLSDRQWKCDCGAEHDRDINAWKNIKREGIRILNLSGINLSADAHKNSTVEYTESYAC
jgi:putative transposase